VLGLGALEWALLAPAAWLCAVVLLLHWVGEPVPVALAAVLVYRVWNFVVPTVPALLARPRIEALCDAADVGRPAPRRVQQRAAAPLGEP
jgi:hypothetical protein